MEPQLNQMQKDHEVRELRSALIQTLEQNEVLRDRVMQLEALMVEAQVNMEEMEEKYVRDMNQIQNIKGGADGEEKKRKRAKSV